MRACEAMISYAGPPFQTSGSEVSIVDIIVEVAVFIVLVVDVIVGRYPWCLVPITGHVLEVGSVRFPDLVIVDAGVFQFVQVGNLLHLVCDLLHLGSDLLHKVIIPASLALVSPGGDPGAH